MASSIVTTKGADWVDNNFDNLVLAMKNAFNNQGKTVTLGSNGGNIISDFSNEFKKAKANDVSSVKDIEVDSNVNAINGSGDVIEDGSKSKLQEVFNVADNYNLSEDTFNNHILARHGSNSTYRNKSHFNADFDIKSEIDGTLKGDNFIIKPNTGDRSGYIFEQTFSNPIGVNSKGKSLYTLKVVIDENGNVVTEFPKK